jgi:hypothetical protein
VSRNEFHPSRKKGTSMLRSVTIATAVAITGVALDELQA